MLPEEIRLEVGPQMRMQKTELKKLNEERNKETYASIVEGRGGGGCVV